MSDYVRGIYQKAFSRSLPKKTANIRVADTFGLQGLSFRPRKSTTILVLDTCELTTTTTLIDRFRGRIRRIIIVEKSNVMSRAIEKKAEVYRSNMKSRGRYCPEIRVVKMDVFDYLPICKVRIDFAWLDLMGDTTKIDFDSIMSHIHNMSCLAITMSARSRRKGDTLQRINEMKLWFDCALEHTVFQYGYRSYNMDKGKYGQPMQIVAFGRRKVPYVKETAQGRETKRRSE